MASTNKTTNLQLPQWEAMDKPERVDFNDAMLKLDTTVGTHVPASAGKHIAESGSNTNGKYIKFDDGTMICTILTSVTTDSALNSVDFDVVFPAPFLNTDYAVSHAWYGGSPGKSGTFIRHASTRATGSIVGATYASLSGENFASVTRTIGTLVIGRWK